MARSTSTRSDSHFIKEHLGGSHAKPEAYPLQARGASYRRGARHARSGPITTSAAIDNSISNELTTTSSILPSGDGLNPTSDPIPSSALPAQSMQPILIISAPTAVPVVAITCAAIGGAVSVAVILALIYVWRIRRRTKKIKRAMNVLGPELMPMTPSSSSLSVRSMINSLAERDETRIVSPPILDPTNSSPPLNAPAPAPSVASPTSAEHLDVPPPYSSRRSSLWTLLPPGMRRPLLAPA
ncbi:hypothetical protein BJV74DRAFT_797857 [Russula compacta]|nr:hypothetical protein BJV74DRAFT_797857 [Russula compacta]